MGVSAFCGKYDKADLKELKFIKDEIQTGHKSVPMKISNKVMKSICKIIIKRKGDILYGTGFFMKISESLKFLFTNYHVINQDFINDRIELEIWNNKKMNINLNQRYIKYFEKPKDITIIEIKEEDKIYKDIKFLECDLNYKEKGYSIYENADVFTLEHPLGDDISCASGKILNIDNYEFSHNISTQTGSSGCPIILLNNNINLILVIGIHKGADIYNMINYGTFIGEIINKFKNDCYFFPKNKKDKKEEEEEEDGIEEDLAIIKENLKKISEDKGNTIISKIYIKKEEVNKFIRIINSYEDYFAYNGFNNLKENLKNEEGLKNEKEIKECEIRINNEIIKFNYFHAFKNEGNYTIRYTFKNLLTKGNHLFSECSSLISIDLSNFKTQNITNMDSMFYNCSSLENIDLSNFNTQNVTDMNFMFYGCSSLKNIDLSNFNTQNVTDMNSMFHNCSSLENIDLSNFNTQNVTNMGYMLFKCISLKKIGLSYYKTQNVTNFIFRKYRFI